MRTPRLFDHMAFISAMFIAIPVSVIADTSVLHCKGVNYIYPSGMGKGPAKREKATRTIKLDLQAMTGELVNGSESRPTQLTKKYAPTRDPFLARSKYSELM